MEKKITEGIERQAKLLVKVIKSGRIEEFKKDPKKLIKEILGIDLPAEHEVVVLEDKELKGHIVVPMLPQNAPTMSDDDLYDVIMGGTCKNTGTLV